MGQQSSQVQKTDTGVDLEGQSQAEAVTPNSKFHEFQSEHSPSPSLHQLDSQGDDFAFSSQIPADGENHNRVTFSRNSKRPPISNFAAKTSGTSSLQSASNTRLASLKSNRAAVSKSRSPPDTSGTSDESNSTSQHIKPTNSASQRTNPQARRRIPKRKDSPNPPNMAIMSDSYGGDVHPFVPHSSMDLDVPMGFGEDFMVADEDQFSGDANMNGDMENDEEQTRAARRKERRERKAAKKAAKLQMKLGNGNPESSNHHSEPEAEEPMAENKPSKKRRRKAQQHTEPEPQQYTGLENIDPALLAGSNELVPISLDHQQNGDAGTSQFATEDAQVSPSKRKAQGSEKKQRKRRKQKDSQDEPIEEKLVDAPEKSTKKHGKKAKTHQLNDADTDVPSSALNNSALLQPSLEPNVSQESPSAARLVRQRSIGRRAPYTRESKDVMDVDGPPNGEEDESDDHPFRSKSHSEDQAANEEADEDMAEADLDDHQVGAEPMETDDHDDGNEAEMSKSKAKNRKQDGKQSGSGRKRVSKPSFFDRDEEDSAEVTANEPTPTAAVSRKRKKKQDSTDEDDQAAAGPSKTRERKVNQTKLTGSPATATRGKQERKVKDPVPEEEVTGFFSDFELRNINVALERWRDDHNLTQQEVNNLVHLNPQKSNTGEFWDYLHAACPRRKRQKLLNICRRKYHNFVARGTWTPEQQDELRNMYEEHGPKYKLIGDLINRHPEDVRDRIRNYVICGDNLRKDAWDQAEENRLINIINDSLLQISELKATQRPDLQAEDDENLIDWQIVSENMGRTRSRLQCQTKWKKIKAALEGGSIDGETGLSIDERIQRARDDVADMSSNELFNIVKAVKKSDVKADSRIPWAKLRSFRGLDKWSRATLILAWSRLKTLVSNWKQMSVPEITAQLIASFSETGELALPDQEEVDLDEENREMSHKLQRILKETNRSRHKTSKSSLVINSDGDEVEEDVEEADVDISAGSDAEARLKEEGNDSVFVDRGNADMAVDDGAKEEEIDESDYASPSLGKGKTRAKGKAKVEKDSDADEDPKIRSKISRRVNHNAENDDDDDDANVSSDASQTAEKPRAATKNARRKSKTAASATKAKAKGKRVGPSISNKSESQQSSDTDADDAEDIPARVA